VGRQRTARGAIEAKGSRRPGSAIENHPAGTTVSFGSAEAFAAVFLLALLLLIHALPSVAGADAGPEARLALAGLFLLGFVAGLAARSRGLPSYRSLRAQEVEVVG
jgi:hypothetical protein